MMNEGTLHPEFDSHGYPTEKTLEIIASWPPEQFAHLLDYVREAWSDYGRIWKEGGDIKMATGGWSGNESIARALRENRVFHALYWQSSHRGGLDIFRIPDASEIKSEVQNG